MPLRFRKLFALSSMGDLNRGPASTRHEAQWQPLECVVRGRRDASISPGETHWPLTVLGRRGKRVFEFTLRNILGRSALERCHGHACCCGRRLLYPVCGRTSASGASQRICIWAWRRQRESSTVTRTVCPFIASVIFPADAHVRATWLCVNRVQPAPLMFTIVDCKRSSLFVIRRESTPARS